jgi:hypothetical protein
MQDGYFEANRRTDRRMGAGSKEGVSSRGAIPFPQAGPPPTAEGRSELVASFVRATEALSAGDAARLAAVRPETLSKWRRRPPRWLKAETARRLAAYLAGELPAPRQDDGFRRAFHRALRPPPVE